MARPFGTFDEAFAWLAARTNYETMATARYDARTYGIARVERLLDAMGRPDRALDVAQVVGSKGKGSTAAGLASILRASGRRTGLFTSPHLVHPRERIAIDGRPADDAVVVDALARLHEHVERAAARGEPATFFEIHTAAALLAFQAERCDAVVLEAGMGGRLDATTAARAVVKVLTSVSVDHAMHLGRTRREIAAEKCAVVRPGVPLVCGERLATDAGRAAEDACRRARAPLIAAGRDFRVRHARTEFDAATGRARTTFRLDHLDRPLDLEVPLLGLHQARNAAVAAVAARVARWNGGPVGDDAVRAGLAVATIRARMEPLSLDPLVLVDGAHSPASFAALGATLRHALPGRRFVVVAGMAADKDVAGAFRRLRPLDATVVATTSGQPRAAPPETVAEAARWAGFPAETAPEAESALRRARRLAGKSGSIVVTGSLYLCGAVLAHTRPGGP